MGPGCRLRAIWAGNSAFWVPGARSERVKSTLDGHIFFPLMVSFSVGRSAAGEGPEQSASKAGLSHLHL